MTDVTPTRGGLAGTRLANLTPAASLAAVAIKHFLVVALGGTILIRQFPALADGLAWALSVNAGLSILALTLIVQTGGWSFRHGRLGACNAVTHLRGSLSCLLVMPLAAPGALADPALGWTLLAIAAIALSLDGLDGWLARRSGIISAYGARFDLEVDSFLALLLALLAWAGGAAGAAVLALGLARYVFWAMSFLLPWMAAPLPERWSRKAVCVVQLGALIALQAPVMPSEAGHAIALAAGALLLWSFGRDTLWLAARAR